jgi:hypothetical protein
LSVSKVLDPPKSPDKLGDFDSCSPFLRGVRGDLKVPKATEKNFSNNLLDSYIIFYRVFEDSVVIVRVISGYRDLKSIFADVNDE